MSDKMRCSGHVWEALDGHPARCSVCGSMRPSEPSGKARMMLEVWMQQTTQPAIDRTVALLALSAAAEAAAHGHASHSMWSDGSNRCVEAINALAEEIGHAR